jgi:hypothetical protein
VEAEITGNPLDRISALELKAARLENVVFGDERTRTESLFTKMDRLQDSIDRVNARQMWLGAGLLFVVGLTCMIITQMVYSGLRG